MEMMIEERGEVLASAPQKRHTVKVSQSEEDQIIIEDVFRNRIYSDKTLACVREIVCNAKDAHTEKGNNNPIEITLPTSLSPTFKVKDMGLGMNPELIAETYASLGSSTKRKTNQIGSYGIGSKAPLAYTDSFQVLTVAEGVTYCYTVYVDGGRKTQIDLVYEVQTPDTQSGTEVIVPVKVGDMDYFKKCVEYVTQFWSIHPTIDGVINESPVKKPLCGSTGEVQGCINIFKSPLLVVYGEVPYALPVSVKNNFQVPISRDIALNAFCIEIADNCLTIPPAREAISEGDYEKIVQIIHNSITTHFVPRIPKLVKASIENKESEIFFNKMLDVSDPESASYLDAMNETANLLQKINSEFIPINCDAEKFNILQIAKIMVERYASIAAIFVTDPIPDTLLADPNTNLQTNHQIIKGSIFPRFDSYGVANSRHSITPAFFNAQAHRIPDHKLGRLCFSAIGGVKVENKGSKMISFHGGNKYINTLNSGQFMFETFPSPDGVKQGTLLIGYSEKADVINPIKLYENTVWKYPGRYQGVVIIPREVALTVKHVNITAQIQFTPRMMSCVGDPRTFGPRELTQFDLEGVARFVAQSNYPTKPLDHVIQITRFEVVNLDEVYPAVLPGYVSPEELSRRTLARKANAAARKMGGKIVSTVKGGHHAKKVIKTAGDEGITREVVMGAFLKPVTNNGGNIFAGSFYPMQTGGYGHLYGKCSETVKSAKIQGQKAIPVLPYYHGTVGFFSKSGPTLREETFGHYTRRWVRDKSYKIPELTSKNTYGITIDKTQGYPAAILSRLTEALYGVVDSSVFLLATPAGMVSLMEKGGEGSVVYLSDYLQQTYGTPSDADYQLIYALGRGHQTVDSDSACLYQMIARTFGIAYGLCGFRDIVVKSETGKYFKSYFLGLNKKKTKSFGLAHYLHVAHKRRTHPDYLMVKPELASKYAVKNLDEAEVMRKVAQISIHRSSELRTLSDFVRYPAQYDSSAIELNEEIQYTGRNVDDILGGAAISYFPGYLPTGHKLKPSSSLIHRIESVDSFLRLNEKF